MTWARCSVAWLMAWVSRIALGTSRSTPSQSISTASPGCTWGAHSTRPEPVRARPFQHLGQGQRRRICGMAIGPAGADAREVGAFGADDMLQGVANRAERAQQSGVQLVVAQPGAQLDDAFVGPEVVAKKGGEGVGRVHGVSWFIREAMTAVTGADRWNSIGERLANTEPTRPPLPAVGLQPNSMC